MNIMKLMLNNKKEKWINCNFRQIHRKIRTKICNKFIKKLPNIKRESNLHKKLKEIAAKQNRVSLHQPQYNYLPNILSYYMAQARINVLISVVKNKAKKSKRKEPVNSL